MCLGCTGRLGDHGCQAVRQTCWAVINAGLLVAVDSREDEKAVVKTES